MRIITPFDGREDAELYRAHVLRLVEKTRGEVPRLVWEQWHEDSLRFSISLVCLERPGVAKFFFEMIGRWLLPSHQLSTALTFSTEFRFAKSLQTYVACEMALAVDDEAEADLLCRNIAFLEKEILMGVSSLYHANKILEMKGLSLDAKTGLIQERIAAFVHRFPKLFDYDIFSEMQHFLISSKEAFKAVRDCEQMSRMIWVLYRFRKELESRVEKAPGKRHICLKMRPQLVQTPFGSKEVLSIFVGLNFLKEHELFEERHFLSALQRFVPGIRSVEGSYFERENKEKLHGFYVEVEKEGVAGFKKQELALLKMFLPDEIKRRIEQLVPPVFMPRNEEEVMRNVLTLSHQLKYTRDLPQVILSFDEQSDAELSFTVVLVRLVQPGSSSIRELLSRSKLAGQILFDRVKNVGMLRRRYPKEAAVFRVRLQSERFLRQDYSVDLYQARQSVLRALQEALGEVRDFNGGMIAKQSENFGMLKKDLGDLASHQALLLQNFFHAIFPAHLSTTLDPKLLKMLFQMLLELVDNHEGIELSSKKHFDRLFVMVKFSDLSLKKKIFGSVENLRIPFNELLSVQLQILDSFYLGFIYLEEDPEKQEAFLQMISEGIGAMIH